MMSKKNRTSSPFVKIRMSIHVLHQLREIYLKPPIVYEDHINKHGEGIHHLAFSVDDMDKVLEDYRSKGYVVSMGGTWGDIGKPGSGRYEYIDLEKAGGLTMELLWNHR